MALKEALYNILPKSEGHSPLILSPSDDLLVGVSPQQVTEETGIWHICWPWDAPDLVHMVELGGQPTVHTEDLAIDNGRHGQAIEAIRERLPQFDVITPLACHTRKHGRVLSVHPEPPCSDGSLAPPLPSPPRKWGSLSTLSHGHQRLLMATREA